MTKVEIITAGERLVEDITVLVPKVTTPVGAQPVNVGLVEISQSQPTELIPGPVGPQGPIGLTGATGAPGADSTVPGPQGPKGDTGNTGATGNTGSQGIQGPAGPANTLAVGTVTTVAPGGAATSTITGTPPTQTLNLGIPSGLQGATGNTGSQGIQGVKGDTGNTGSTGSTGAPGPANTLAIGTVTTVAPGGAATSTITGSSPNQTLNLGIPRGDVGATGSQGIQGPPGADGAGSPATVPPLMDGVAAVGTTTKFAREDHVHPSDTSRLAATALTRNRVINGAMQVSQENGNTAGTTTGYYGADQWFTGFSSTGTITTQRVQSSTPNGSYSRYRATITVADASLAATEHCFVSTKIEGNRVVDFRYGSSSAKQSILRFGWKSPAGTYSVVIMNSSQNRTYAANFTVTAGQANTDTEQVLAIPGDVTGTWLDVSLGFDIRITLATGTTYQGVAGWQSGVFLGTSANTNGMASAGAVFELFDVGLYLDPQTTGVAPAWQMPDEAEELQACQRYWQKYLQYVIDISAGYYTTTNIVEMRANPAITGGGAGFTVVVNQPNNTAVYQTARTHITLILSARM